MKSFFAIVNPAAGGGRSAKLAPAALERLLEKGIVADTVTSSGPGHAAKLAGEAYDRGYRQFLAVGGDGTAHEIVNGIFANPKRTERVALGFLPLGTGNSFLRDFSSSGAEASFDALLAGKTRPVDLLKLTHAAGEIYSFNLLSIGFTADVATLTNRYFKPLGPAGYLLGVLVRVVQLRRGVFALRCDADADWDRRRSLFLSFNNSKFTGGNMMIAPDANPCDGLIEFVRWGPIGRAGLLSMLPRLYDGSHLKHPLAEHRAVRRVEFDIPSPIDVMIDGEVCGLQCRSLEIVPDALDIYI